ncbi:MAG: transporter [Flavobacteriaceae bacterium]|nr:transporter [Flavobacteriaceae bacterium]
MKTLPTYFVLAIALIYSNAVFSQYTDVINSNRPGVSQSAYSVGKNVLQFEAGLFTVKEEHTPLGYEVSGFGAQFAARYGLFFEQLEINLEGFYQSDTFTDMRSSIDQETGRSNFRNFTVGAKYLLYDPYKYSEEEKPNLYSYHANRGFKWKFLIPSVSVYAGINIDSKNNPYTAPDVEGISPKVMVATQHNFTGGWVFVMNFVKDRIGSDYSDFQYILTLTKSVGQQWAVFGETQGIQSDFYADNLFRLGGAYLWTRNFQVDTAVTFNTKDTPSVLNISLGASYRLDWHQDPDVNTDNQAGRSGSNRANR